MHNSWVRNDPSGRGRIARIFFNDVEYSKVSLDTIQGELIFEDIRDQVYDRVDIDEEVNFVLIKFSVLDGTRNTRFRGERGRRLIHTMTLIRDEVQHILKINAALPTA